MPDGDRVYGGLSQAYEKPYEEICEGHFDALSIGWDLLGALLQTIRSADKTGVFDLLLDVADELKRLTNAANADDEFAWTELRRMARSKAMQAQRHKYYFGLASNACERYITALQYGREVADHRRALVGDYLVLFYQAYFDDRRPRSMHYCGIDEATFRDRLAPIQSYIMDQLRRFATSIARHGNANALKRPPNTYHRLQANDDLLSIH